jgi:photosystem II stability/assembly factor-like uncharacterized protein
MGLLKISFVDSAWGWTVGDLGISRSTDGGRNWQVQNNQTGMKDVSALTRTKAWAVGATGAILATTNGGTSWFSQIPPVSQDFLSVSFSDTLHGLVGGANYYVLVTSNGGATWDTVRASSSRLKDVCLIESLYGWFVDYYGDIQRTTDGGRTWQTMINRPNLVSVHFANRDTGWVAQETKILKTTNGGVSWDSLSVGLLWSRTINDARLLSGKTGMIATGWPGQPQIPAILKVTWDGGTRWSSYRWLWNMSYRKAGSHLSTTLGCFAGSGGSHAFRLRSDLTWDVASIAQESLGYAQGSPSVWGLDFVDSSTGWAVGQNGARVITTDGGVSWRLQKIDSGIGSVLTSVKAFNTQTARAIGYLGRSVLTTDGGITWVNEETGTDEWLLTSSFLSPTQGWVAGEDGMVLKYGLLPSGVETERGGTPNTWITALEQNRPNPFQDETGIRYQLARKEHVRLIVYNVLGQAVRRLVDGTQTPGAYVVSWDGKDGAEHPSPSGVYFYRLEAGGQSQTRKTVKVR